MHVLYILVEHKVTCQGNKKYNCTENSAGQSQAAYSNGQEASCHDTILTKAFITDYSECCHSGSSLCYSSSISQHHRVNVHSPLQGAFHLDYCHAHKAFKQTHLMCNEGQDGTEEKMTSRHYANRRNAVRCNLIG